MFLLTFCFIKNIISTSVDEDTLHIIYLKNNGENHNDVTIENNNIDQKSVNDNSIHEEYIAEHLDHFISLYPSALYEIPQKSLYNIFNHPQRVLNNTQKAYEFIAKSHNPELFSLFPSLNGDELDNKLLLDHLSKSGDYNGYSPKLSPAFYCSVKKQINHLRSENMELKSVLLKLFSKMIKNKNFEDAKLIISNENIDLNFRIVVFNSLESLTLFNIL